MNYAERKKNAKNAIEDQASVSSCVSGDRWILVGRVFNECLFNHVLDVKLYTSVDITNELHMTTERWMIICQCSHN